MKNCLLLLTVLLSGAAAGAVAQERIKPKGLADFASVHASIAEHWKAEKWGQCFSAARELVGLVSIRRGKAIRDAMPPAPPGYELVPVEAETNAQANAMLGAVAAGVGTVVEQTYRGQGTHIQITVTADSPMLQMFSMIVQNPAMLQSNQELIKYTECAAVLETDGSRVTLRLLLGDSLVEASFQNANGDFAVQMFDQKAVTKLHGAIKG